MTPEQIRAKQKLIGAFRQIIGAVDTIKEHAPILIPGEREVFEALDKLRPVQGVAREGIEFFQNLPDTTEISPGGSFVQSPELPPEGPGIEDTDPPPVPPVLIA